MKAHDPKTCKVCQELGDWTKTPDTEAWLKAHDDAGNPIKLGPGVLPGPMEAVTAFERNSPAVDIHIKEESATVAGYMMRMDAAFKAYGITARDCLLAGIIFNAMNAVEGQPLLAIEMPCGQKVEYQSKDDLPDGTAMCPCGNPNHYLVRFEWNEEEKDA